MKTADKILLELEKQIQLLEKDDNLVERWSKAIEEMMAAPAESLDGIRAKARAACSLRLGDLDEEIFDSSAPHKDATLPNSILRDLIRLYDPHLERKGAVQALVASLG